MIRKTNKNDNENESLNENCLLFVVYCYKRFHNITYRTFIQEKQHNIERKNENSRIGGPRLTKCQH